MRLRDLRADVLFMTGRHAAQPRGHFGAPLDLVASVGRRFVSPLVTLFLGLGALVLSAAAVATIALGLTVHTVLTGSMTGTYDRGSIVIARTIPVSDVRPGQVLVFTPPGETTPYTHRVMTVTPGPEGPVITTKGDANPAPDSWHARLVGSTTQEVLFGIPSIGRLLLPLRQHQPLLIGLLGLLIAISGSRMILGRPQNKPLNKSQNKSLNKSQHQPTTQPA